jgi:hypothetical protein
MNFKSLVLRLAAVVVRALILTHVPARAGVASHTKKTTFRTLYTFTGGSDGFDPVAGLVFDSHRNLYGTTLLGGTVNGHCPPGCGTVFQLVPQLDGTWKLNTIHSFVGAPKDVSSSVAHVTFDRKGNLYGTERRMDRINVSPTDVEEFSS